MLEDARWQEPCGSGVWNRPESLLDLSNHPRTGDLFSRINKQEKVGFPEEQIVDWWAWGNYPSARSDFHLSAL